MSLSEGAAIVLGFFAGYWVISKLFFRSTSAEKPPGSNRGSSATQGPAGWYEILQVPPLATSAEIRSAYKHLISKYHPDRVESLGQELKELAQRKSQDITAAYREGMRARGEAP